MDRVSIESESTMPPSLAQASKVPRFSVFWVLILVGLPVTVPLGIGIWRGFSIEAYLLSSWFGLLYLVAMLIVRTRRLPHIPHTRAARRNPAEDEARKHTITWVCATILWGLFGPMYALRLGESTSMSPGDVGFVLAVFGIGVGLAVWSETALLRTRRLLREGTNPAPLTPAVATAAERVKVVQAANRRRDIKWGIAIALAGAALFAGMFALLLAGDSFWEALGERYRLLGGAIAMAGEMLFLGGVFLVVLRLFGKSR